MTKQSKSTIRYCQIKVFIVGVVLELIWEIFSFKKKNTGLQLNNTGLPMTRYVNFYNLTKLN